MKQLIKKAEAHRLAVKKKRAELLELYNKYEGIYTKLEMEPDESRYDDSYIDTWNVSDKLKLKARKELWDLIEREGVWVVVSYYWDLAQGCWEVGGSVGGCVPDGKHYEEDLKVEAAACLQECFQAQADELAKRVTYAAG